MAQSSDGSRQSGRGGTRQQTHEIVIDAPIEAVWKAITDAEELTRWFVEEATFRGLGYSLLAPYGQIAAVLAIGILFGLAHGLVEALPILVALGVGLAYLRARTDSLYPCFIVHALFNAIALTLAVTT